MAAADDDPVVPDLDRSYEEIAAGIYPRLSHSWEGEIVRRVVESIEFMDHDAIVALHTITQIHLARQG